MSGSRTPAYIFIGLLALLLLILPPHVAARCFGVPEESKETETAAWSMEIAVTTTNGLDAAVTLGYHPNATSAYDVAYDIGEPLFERGFGEPRFDLYAYFFYPENIETSSIFERRITVALVKSIVPPEPRTTWPLQIDYLEEEDTEITLRWETDAARELAGYELELITPFEEVLGMTMVSNYTFNATESVYEFTISATARTGQSDAALLVAAGTAYAVVMAIIFGLRRLRKRQRRA